MKPTLSLLLLLAAAACSGSEVRDAPAVIAEGEPAGGAEAALPDSIRDTINLEGMPEPILLRRFQSPAEFPLQFSTYVPADMVPEVDPRAPGDPGAGLRFIANFGGTRTEDAFVHVFAYPAGASLAVVQGTARAFIESRGVTGSAAPEIGPRSVRRFGWSVHEEGYRYQRAAAQWVVGTLALGSHGSRYFHVVTQYPEEFGDGFGPRAERIFAHWRWADTSQPLGLEGPPSPPSTRAQ